MYDIISGYPSVDAILSGIGAYDIVGAPPALAAAAAHRLPAYGRYAPPYAPAHAYAGQQAAAMAALQQQQAQYAHHQQLQRYADQRMVNQASLLRYMEPTKARRQYLGMASTGTVAAAGTAAITSRPQSFAYKPERLFIPSTVGPDFIVNDIKVGNVSQLVQTGDLPAEMFGQTSFGVEMDFDTVQTSQDFVVQVTNISGAARQFRAGIVGRAANG